MTLTCHNCDRRAADSSLLCTTCADGLVKQLWTVPGLVDDMTITRARLDRMSRGRLGGKSADTPLPIRIDKYDTRPTDRPLDHLNNVILEWAHALADHLRTDLYNVLGAAGLRVITGYARGGARPDNATVSSEPFLAIELAAVWMAHHPEQLRHHPAADEMYDDITDAVDTARKAVDRLPELAYKGTCESVETDGAHDRTCGADLYVERGAQYARCPRCNAHYLVETLDRRILAHMHDMIYTAAELGPLLTELGFRLPSSSIRVWAHRGQLTSRGWKHNGRITDRWIHRNDPPVYRLGDVLELAKNNTRTVRD